MREYDALARLVSLAQPGDEPTLTTGELEAILLANRLEDSSGFYPDAYTYWKPSRSYLVGDYVVPLTRNGFYYSVESPGTSDTTEPAWPTTVGDTVNDGGVIYANAGTTTWTETFDLMRAAAQAWELKAAKAAPAYNLSVEGKSLNRGEIFDHCVQMAKIYGRRARPQSVGWNRPGIIDRDGDWIANN